MNKIKKFNSSLEDLEHFNFFIEKFLKDNKCDTKLINKILTSCEEIFINICKYAYNGNSGEIFLDVRLNMSKIIIEIQDSGIPFDPVSYVSKKANKTTKIGGLGIFLVKRLMDSVKYSRINNKNVLTIIKKWKGDDENG